MTESEKKTLVRTMTDETDDDVLSAYLSLAKHIVMVKAYPFVDDPDSMEFPYKYDSVHVEITAYLLNKRGAEGETVHLEDSVSRHYEDGSVPPSLLRRIVPCAGVLTR